MREFVIMTDSCCDMPAQLADELGIVVLPLTVLLGEDSFKNYLDGREIGFKAFYDRVRGGAMPTTSAVSVGAFEEAMRSVLEAGKDLLCLNFSSALSTTYNSFAIAADDLKPRYLDRKIYAVDTLSASVGQGLLVYQAAMMAGAGRSIEETRDWGEANKLHVCHWITVNDLFPLKRGGRVSATTAVMGTMLQIKPVLIVNNEGRLDTVAKARGRKAALTMLAEKVAETAIVPKNQTMFISHSACREDAEFVVEEIRKRCGVKEVVLSDIGPVIGSHTGVGCVAMCFLGTGRETK